MISKAWLSLGANIGNPRQQLIEALHRIGENPQISILAQSSVIATKAWGKTDQPDFANMAVSIETSLKPAALLDTLLGIEVSMGRIRDQVWGPRLIDIDIIAYDRFEIRTAKLTLPHPYAHQRDFVLIPLREIDAETAQWVEDTAQKPR